MRDGRGIFHVIWHLSNPIESMTQQMARKQMRVDQLISNNIYVDYEYICLWQLYSRKGDFMENKLKQIYERNSEPRDGQGADQQCSAVHLWLFLIDANNFPIKCVALNSVLHCHSANKQIYRFDLFISVLVIDRKTKGKFIWQLYGMNLRIL